MTRVRRPLLPRAIDVSLEHVRAELEKTHAATLGELKTSKKSADVTQLFAEQHDQTLRGLRQIRDAIEAWFALNGKLRIGD